MGSVHRIFGYFLAANLNQGVLLGLLDSLAVLLNLRVVYVVES